MVPQPGPQRKSIGQVLKGFFQRLVGVQPPSRAQRERKALDRFAKKFGDVEKFNRDVVKANIRAMSEDDLDTIIAAPKAIIEALARDSANEVMTRGIKRNRFWYH